MIPASSPVSHEFMTGWWALYFCHVNPLNLRHIAHVPKYIIPHLPPAVDLATGQCSSLADGDNSTGIHAKR